jgi:glutamate/aspartate transport system substrate-binding protein
MKLSAQPHARPSLVHCLASSVQSLSRWVLAGLCLCATTAVCAQESPTLRKIRDANTMVVGYRENSPPFSYHDAALLPIGYSVDICKHVVQAIKQHLRMNQLRVQWIPVSATTRFPMMSNRIIDMECGASTNTLERQQLVAFSLTTFVTQGRLLSKKSQPIKRLEDLRGQSVVSTAGTTNLQQLIKLNEQRQLRANVLTVKDDAEAFAMVASNRAVAYAMDDVLLRGTLAAQTNPGDFVISQDVLSVEPYGIMLPLGDIAFKQLVDTSLLQLFASGAIDKIYQQWFNAPTAPQGLSLRMPMSAIMQKVIKQPTDTADPAHYR